MEKTREEMEKDIEFLNKSLRNSKNTVVGLIDRNADLEKEINFYKAIIKYLIRY